MALSLTRLNLAPTSRALASGLPVSAVNHALKGIQAGGHGSGHSIDEHGDNGPRKDAIPAWVSRQSGVMQSSRSVRKSSERAKRASFYFSGEGGWAERQRESVCLPSVSESLFVFRAGRDHLCLPSGARVTLPPVRRGWVGRAERGYSSLLSRRVKRDLKASVSETVPLLDPSEASIQRLVERKRGQIT